MASPLASQPKHRYRPISGFTENEGVFSAWNGQSPTKRLPTRFSARCSLARATRSLASRTRATSSSRMPIGPRCYGGRGGGAAGGGAPPAGGGGGAPPPPPRPRPTPRGAGTPPAGGRVGGPPPEQLDAEPERVGVGHAAHVTHRQGGGVGAACDRRRHLAVADHRDPPRRVGEVLDQIAEQADDARRLPASRGA